jgi:TolB-like protein
MMTFSCAYKLSNAVDKLPGGVQAIVVPMFINESKEPNIEVFFTNAFKTEVLRFGRINLVNSESQAEAVVTGTIKSVKIVSDESVIESKNAKYLPYGTVLATQVKVTVVVSMKMTEIKTQKILWSGDYTQSKNYTPPQITLPVINSANNLYNLSERRQTLETLSKDMMQLALDRLVDNF